MRKILLITFCLLYLMMTPTSYANYVKETEATRENLLEDAVLDLLQPLMGKAMEDYYGTTYNIGTHCERVLDIKKLDHPGSWLFEAEIEFTTFTGAHNSLDIFTVTLKKDWGDLDWVLKDYKVKKADLNHECRSPA
jgi:hypothetical protein